MSKRPKWNSFRIVADPSAWPRGSAPTAGPARYRSRPRFHRRSKAGQGRQSRSLPAAPGTRVSVSMATTEPGGIR